ncbi:MAG: helix-turn-helix transcriptional regulator [Syntrophorhabdaceae bacterium]|nr:helix-turn-helix transcriptional regulator [Syntrophorhabdaceae bacterium]
MEILTAKELSNYLKINEKNVYKLVQEGKLPYLKIGGKIAFSREIIDRWILERTVRDENILIAGSDDVFLRKIIDVYNSMHTPIVYYAPVGSINGLKILKKAGATMSSVHILDVEKKAYNLSYIERYLSKDGYVVIHLFYRKQGLYLQRNNPRGIRGFEDLATKGVRFVNRNVGSGTRLLFDFLIAERNIEPSSIDGYNREVNSHLEAGLSILNGEGDASFGIMYIASLLGLGFIPMFDERFDLVVPEDRFFSANVKRFLSFFDQSTIMHYIKDFRGYDTSRIGSILYPENM